LKIPKIIKELNQFKKENGLKVGGKKQELQIDYHPFIFSRKIF
jgi:hypothetical protein